MAGALLGAGAGGIIGNQSGRGLEGAAIGGILGALAGNAIGQSRQQQQFAPRGFNRGYGQPQYGPAYQSGYSPAFGQQQCAPQYGNPYGFNPGW